jgi:glycosyltransferase involved in cell wall biosynthesis
VKVPGILQLLDLKHSNYMYDRRVLIIHPEGNINNNPNLTGIVEILCENGYIVSIVSPKKEIIQISPCEGSNLIIYKKEYNILDFLKLDFPLILKIRLIIDKQVYLLGISARIIKNAQFFCSAQKMVTIIECMLKKPVFQSLLNWSERLFLKDNRYLIIIGIDRDGIILASETSHFLKTSCGLISYEIFFQNETSEEFKRVEKISCRDIKFAICQDSVRSYHLSTENDIPLEKIINIPVAGRGTKKGEKTKYIHNALNIPNGKKIALYAGSIYEWAMIKELIQSVSNWPDNWVLVLHDRYGAKGTLCELMKGVMNKSIYISNEIFPRPEDLTKMIKAIDAGIALYEPKYSGMYDGNNLKYLGLASGKISTYLQHGVPVIMNENGIISEYIQQYHAGFVVKEIQEIAQVLHKVDQTKCKDGCYSLFSEVLDLDANINPLMQKMNELFFSVHDSNETPSYL